jgi:hypothetical protein
LPHERTLPHERIVAVGLLTQGDLNVLGPTFSRAWPVEQTPTFNELLRAIDDADAQLRAQAMPHGQRRPS